MVDVPKTNQGSEEARAVVTSAMPIPPPSAPVTTNSGNLDGRLNEIFKLVHKDSLTKMYKKTKTERFARGILQKINNAFEHGHYKTRQAQINEIDTLVSDLQSNMQLSAQDKGVILHGALEKIAQDIHAENNKFKSRFEDVCHKIQQDLKNIGITHTDPKVTQRLYYIYLKEGVAGFKRESDKAPPPSSPRVR